MGSVNMVLGVLVVLVNVAFITLLERKILGYSQLRKGPNNVGLGGVVQPFNDAVNLFSKELITPSVSNNSGFLFAPGVALFLVLFVWQSMFLGGGYSNIGLSFLLIYTVLSINIYPLLCAGWASNSNYAAIGALRGVAQTVSYEVSFALLILFYACVLGSIGLSGIASSGGLANSLIILPLLGVWGVTCLAETNRTPFDFAEGESELVSGFNVEYGAVGFAVIFMAEYASIYFISALLALVFFVGGVEWAALCAVSSGFVFFWVWVRCTLPRYRYDLLIGLAWKSFLPLSLGAVGGLPALLI